MKLTSILTLTEARKNPELNPTVSINDALKAYVEKHGKANSYVSFTELNKLGINPQSKHDTPNGIYAYPIDYVLRKIGISKSADVIPYAGEAEYATAFTVQTGNLVNLKTVTKEQIDQLIAAASDLVPDKDKFLAAVQYIRANKPAKAFWDITRIAAQHYFHARPNALATPTQWAKTFRLLGYDGVIDKGTGTIRPGEPTQIVIFTREHVSNEQRLYNKYSPDLVARSSDFGNQIKQLMQPEVSSKQKLEMLLHLTPEFDKQLATQSLSHVFRAIGAETLANPSVFDLVSTAQLADPTVEAAAYLLLDHNPSIMTEWTILNWLLSCALKRSTRSPVVEERVLSSESIAVDRLMQYADKFFPDKRWEQLEPVIIKIGNTLLLTRYMNKHWPAHTRWVEAEQEMLNAASHHSPTVLNNLITYATKVIGGRWREAEPILKAAGGPYYTTYQTMVS